MCSCVKAFKSYLNLFQFDDKFTFCFYLGRLFQKCFHFIFLYLDETKVNLMVSVLVRCCWGVFFFNKNNLYFFLNILNSARVQRINTSQLLCKNRLGFDFTSLHIILSCLVTLSFSVSTPSIWFIFPVYVSPHLCTCFG